MSALPHADLEKQVAAVRRFNRFYTQRLGVLQDGWLGSAFSLTEARVLYEITRRAGVSASVIARELGLDAGYLSRILRRLHRQGLISRHKSPGDGRQSILSMTAAGKEAFAPLENRTNQQVESMLGRLPAPDRDRLVASMQTVQALLTDEPRAPSEIILREPRHGDYGWIVSRHAALYAQEYGWTENFEGLCAQIVADFINKFDPRRERCWIADINGRNVGCVMLAKETETVARLRLLLVEPEARGYGLGKRLTAECVQFARQCGYSRITLWTHSVLTAARHVYEQAGFRLTWSEPRRSWGQDVVSEHWDLEL